MSIICPPEGPLDTVLYRSRNVVYTATVHTQAGAQDDSSTSHQDDSVRALWQIPNPTHPVNQANAKNLLSSNCTIESAASPAVDPRDHGFCIVRTCCGELAVRQVPLQTRFWSHTTRIRFAFI